MRHGPHRPSDSFPSRKCRLAEGSTTRPFAERHGRKQRSERFAAHIRHLALHSRQREAKYDRFSWCEGSCFAIRFGTVSGRIHRHKSEKGYSGKNLSWQRDILKNSPEKVGAERKQKRRCAGLPNLSNPNICVVRLPPLRLKPVSKNRSARHKKIENQVFVLAKRFAGPFDNIRNWQRRIGNWNDLLLCVHHAICRLPGQPGSSSLPAVSQACYASVLPETQTFDSLMVFNNISIVFQNRFRWFVRLHGSELKRPAGFGHFFFSILNCR